MTKREIFIKAHQIAHNTVKFVGNYLIAFSFALKEVYQKMSNTTKDKLLAMGLNVWAKGDKERIYLKAWKFYDKVGLKITKRPSGSISESTWDGEIISHSFAGRLIGELNNAYYDCKNDEWVGLKHFTPEQLLK